jgi:hypothetical protein
MIRAHERNPRFDLARRRKSSRKAKKSNVCTTDGHDSPVSCRRTQFVPSLTVAEVARLQKLAGLPNSRESGYFPIAADLELLELRFLCCLLFKRVSMKQKGAKETKRVPAVDHHPCPSAVQTFKVFPRREDFAARRSVETTDFTDGHGSSPANSRDSYRLSSSSEIVSATTEGAKRTKQTSRPPTFSRHRDWDHATGTIRVIRGQPSWFRLRRAVASAVCFLGVWRARATVAGGGNEEP